MWHEVTYRSGVTFSEALGTLPTEKTDLVYATSYETQATNGAGMVADFFLKTSETTRKRTHTFAQVVSVKEAVPTETVRLDLSRDDVSYIQMCMKLKDPEGSTALRDIIARAVSNSWSYDAKRGLS